MTTTERIGITTRNYSIGSTSGRVKLSEISRPFASSCNYPSPQHSFEYSHATDRLDMSITGKGIAEVSETNTRSKSLEKELTTKSLTKAPLISISAIVGDLASDISTVEAEGNTNDNHAKIIKEEETEVEERKQKLEPDKGDATVAVIAEGNLAISAQVETETEESLEEAQVVPVWEPDTQQDDQIAPVTQSAPQQKRDNNVNEVCPWEDE